MTIHLLGKKNLCSFLATIIGKEGSRELKNTPKNHMHPHNCTTYHDLNNNRKKKQTFGVTTETQFKKEGLVGHTAAAAAVVGT